MIELGLRPTQKIKLKMTPKMKQAVSILKYSSAELTDFVQNEALENPLIELEGYRESFSGNTSTYESVNHDSSPIDFIGSSDDSLYTYLQDQIILLNLTKKEKKIINYLLLTIDDNGYIKEDICEVATHLIVTTNDIEQALNTIQQLEPIGIGATCLKECLSIQASYYYPENKVVQQIITKHLENLSMANFELIATELDISEEDVKSALKIIQSLNPKPGSNIEHHTNQTNYIAPDLYAYINNSEIMVEVNEQVLPKFHVSREYNQWRKLEADRETTTFLENKYKKMMWLQQTIDHRRITLLNVMEAIVQFQSDFFHKGPLHLHPLTLKEIAKRCDVHVSTISRATTNKYVDTPFGLYELKHFFSSSIKQKNGDETSARKIKHLIMSLIEKENIYAPLSDQKIANILKEKGFIISRRTVSKYREQLRIPSSKVRKEIRKLTDR